MATAAESPRSLIQEFQEFLADEVQPATAELNKLQNANRIHLQRLVYTNVVDRFDFLVDALLLKMATQSDLKEQLLSAMAAQVSEGMLIRSMLSASTGNYEFAFDRLRDEMRATVLRQRHSKKVDRLCKAILPALELKAWGKPRVNDNDGQIFTKRKANAKVPLSIIGYSDWLYSRRNAVVHGGAARREFLESDYRYICEHFNEASTLTCPGS